MSEHAFPMSFAGMTLDKCIVLRIGTFTGCPLCRESHPLCRLKKPTEISIWLLPGYHPATRSVQSTPADNPRKRGSHRLAVYRERKKIKMLHISKSILIYIILIVYECRVMHMHRRKPETCRDGPLSSTGFWYIFIIFKLTVFSPISRTSNLRVDLIFHFGLSVILII